MAWFRVRDRARTRVEPQLGHGASAFRIEDSRGRRRARIQTSTSGHNHAARERPLKLRAVLLRCAAAARGCPAPEIESHTSPPEAASRRTSVRNIRQGRRPARSHRGREMFDRVAMARGESIRSAGPSRRVLRAASVAISSAAASRPLTRLKSHSSQGAAAPHYQCRPRLPRKSGAAVTSSSMLVAVRGICPHSPGRLPWAPPHLAVPTTHSGRPLPVPAMRPTPCPAPAAAPSLASDGQSSWLRGSAATGLASIFSKSIRSGLPFDRLCWLADQVAAETFAAGNPPIRPCPQAQFSFRPPPVVTSSATA